MTRKNKIILYGGVSLLTISYIIYNRWSKRIFYDEVLKRIGGGTINFDDLKAYEKTALVPLMLLIICIGLLPNSVLETINTPARHLAEIYGVL